MKTSAKQIASRYVRALFEIAGDKNARELVEKDFAGLTALLEESDAFRDLLTNPLLSRAQQEQALNAVLKQMKANPVTQQFLALLAKQKRLPVLPDVIALFGEWSASARGEMTAEIISAAPLSAKDIAAVSERLSKAYGKKVAAHARTDKALLGGMIVRIGSVQLDSSLAGKINRLKQTLKAA